MSNKEEYKIICEQHKDIPVFLQPWWLDKVCPAWDVAIARKDGKVAGVWPYSIETKMGISILRNPNLTPYLGPHIFSADIKKDRKRDVFEHETVADLMKQLPPFKVWDLEVQPGMNQVGIFRSYDLLPQARQTFLLDLAADETVLLANMKDTTRHNIRIGGEGMTITNSPEHVHELYDFYKSTLTAKGLPVAFSLEYLQELMKACIDNKAAALWVAKKDGKIYAIVWQVWDAKCSYYLMSARNPEVKDKRAVSTLLWHCIKEAKKTGAACFDFEGSIDVGVEQFFRTFGGDRHLYLVLHKNDSVLWQLKKALRK